MQPLPRKVLVVRLGAIGDVVNALVFAEALKAADPSVELGWAVHDLAAPLVRDHPAVDRVHLWPRGAGLGGVAGVVREVRAEGYELAVDLQRLAKSALLARLSGARRVLGFDAARAKEHSSWLTKERLVPGDPGAHMVEQYLEFARHLGLVGATVRRRLPMNPDAEAWAEDYVASLRDAPVVISLGASKPANRWLPERFGMLAAVLSETTRAPVVLTGGPGEVGVAELAESAVGSAGGVRNLVGETDLLQLSSLLSRARLFIGCDSGPMHMAAAHGVGVVALFGPADPRRTGPYGDGHRIVRVPPECAPCNRKHCNAPRHACMLDIDVKLVLDAAQDLLASG